MPAQPATVFSRQWRPLPLLLGHLAAALLLASFIWPTGHELWRSLDQALFFQLNGSLADGGSWARFWAWANVRAADSVAALIILASLTFTGLGLQRRQLQPALIGFVLLMVLMFLVRRSLHEWALAQGLSGQSPSLVLQPAYMLSELAPDIPTKDRSGRSFPGDHAAVLLCWVGMLALNLRHKVFALIPLGLALLLMLPRVVGGAHWASDNLVGGTFTALVTLSWAFCTPLLQQATDAFWRLLRPLIELFGRLPLLGRLPFFNP